MAQLTHLKANSKGNRPLSLWPGPTRKSPRSVQTIAIADRPILHLASLPRPPRRLAIVFRAPNKFPAIERHDRSRPVPPSSHCPSFNEIIWRLRSIHPSIHPSIALPHFSSGGNWKNWPRSSVQISPNGEARREERPAAAERLDGNGQTNARPTAGAISISLKVGSSSLGILVRPLSPARLCRLSVAAARRRRRALHTTIGRRPRVRSRSRLARFRSSCRSLAPSRGTQRGPSSACPERERARPI